MDFENNNLKSDNFQNHNDVHNNATANNQKNACWEHYNF